MVRDMLKECLRMSMFDHLHVLTLKRVCLDGGPAPYIIMPFMANGSLLAYLKKNRNSLVICQDDTDDQASVSWADPHGVIKFGLDIDSCGPYRGRVVILFVKYVVIDGALTFTHVDLC